MDALDELFSKFDYSDLGKNSAKLVKSAAAELARLRAELARVNAKSDYWRDLYAPMNAELERTRAERDAARQEAQRLRVALESAKEWADRIAGDERVCGWVHGEDYGLYMLIADCPVDFAALDATQGNGE